MTLWDHLCCLGYGLGARWDGFAHHWLKGHPGFHWRTKPCLWDGCMGDMHCEECPDTPVEDGKHVGVAIWCRHWQWMNWVARRVCGLIGHPLFQHPKQHDQYLTTELYCYRCGARSELRKEWPTDGDEKDREAGPPEGP